MFRFSRTDVSHGLRDGDVIYGIAVHPSITNLERRTLTVEVPSQEALTQQFQTVHLGLDAASAVVAASSSPDLATAPAVTVFQGLVFLRGGITARALRSAVA